ncbi:MAG: hypothetical protein U5N55_11665 [Cypionkella sp.]|nr:hypothetical protein [Cypionkella sp.]
MAFDVLVQDADGVPVSTSGLNVYFTVSLTPGGSPLMEEIALILTDAAEARFSLVATSAALALVEEGRAHSYTIWSKRAADADPIVRVAGQIVLLPSVQRPA